MLNYSGSWKFGLVSLRPEAWLGLTELTEQVWGPGLSGRRQLDDSPDLEWPESLSRSPRSPAFRWAGREVGISMLK